MRKRQDLVFQKRDIIQSTLAGEIPARRSSTSEVHPFRSPPPTVAWSPVYPNRVPPQPNIAPAGDFPVYVTNSLGVETFSNDDIQSFLILNLERSRRKLTVSVDSPQARLSSEPTASGIPPMNAQFR